MRLKKAGATSLTCTIFISALILGACDRPEKDLMLADLTHEEHAYIERFVILERAKAVALNDRDLGNTILDSLSQAWGDSIESETAALAPVKPLRSKAVHELLKRIIIAEKDSLMQVPLPRRLSLPLSDPPISGR